MMDKDKTAPDEYFDAAEHLIGCEQNARALSGKPGWLVAGSPRGVSVRKEGGLIAGTPEWLKIEGAHTPSRYGPLSEPHSRPAVEGTLLAPCSLSVGDAVVSSVVRHPDTPRGALSDPLRRGVMVETPTVRHLTLEGGLMMTRMDTSDS